MAPETGFASAEKQSSSPFGTGGAVGGLSTGSTDIAGGGGLLSPLDLGRSKGSSGAPWLDPGGHAGSPWADHAGGKDPGSGGQLTVRPERDSKEEIKSAVDSDSSKGPQPSGAAKTQPGIQAPEQLDKALADPNSADGKRAAALGLSPQQYKQEYLHEFMARLAQTDPFVAGPDGKPVMDKDGKPVSNYSDGQKKALQQWGYNPVIDPNHVVDHNKDTGLFAIRFDPTSQGVKNGAAPVVAFRGTEPDRGAKDLKADAGDRYIGASQYEPAKDEIQRQLFGGSSKVDVAGYSLGASLAQRSLVDNAAKVRSLSTFQGPGIAGADAAKVNADIAKYGIEAQHHFFTNDIVHRAGEAKVNGTYHEYTRDDWATGADSLTAHTSSFLIGSDASTGSRDAHGDEKKVDAYTNQTDSAQIKSYQNDQQKDRAFWEKQRRTLGPSGSNLLDLMNPWQNLWKKTDAEGTVAKDANNQPIAGPVPEGFHQFTKGGGEIGSGLGNLARGGGQTVSGIHDLMNGQLGKGLGELGTGVANGWNGLQQEGRGVADMWHGAKESVGALGHFAVHDLLPRIPDIAKVAGGLPDILAHLGHDPSVQKKLGPIGGRIAGALATAHDIGFNPLDPIGSAPNMLLKGAEAAAGPAGRLANKVGTGISNGFHSAVDTAGNLANKVGTGVSNGFHSAVDTAGNLANKVGTGVSNGFHSAVDTAGNLANKVGTGVSNGFHSAVDTAGNLANKVGTGVSNGFHSAVDTAGNLANKVGTGVSNGFHSAVETGSEIGHGISSGVSSLASKARKLLPW